MKTIVKLCGGQKLSYLGEVHIDLALKGKHFDSLALVNRDAYETAVLSVLGDLMDEDPYKLTLNELYHLFTLVKIQSLGSKISFNVQCQHEIQNDKGVWTRCGHSNPFEFSLLESDLVYAPEVYVVPEVSFTFKGEERQYYVRPPIASEELDLWGYFAEKGVSREQLLSDAESSRPFTLSYAKHRIMLHLVDKEDNTNFFDRARREAAVEAISENPLYFMKAASMAMEEVNKYGLSTKRMQVDCGRCGGRSTFRIPLGGGLSL